MTEWSLPEVAVDEEPGAANASTSPLTRATRAGIEIDEMTHSVVPPIHLSTTYAFKTIQEKAGLYDYGRTNTPTRHLLTDTLVDLEGGAGGVVTATGMGAVTVAIAALVPEAGVVAIPHDCYGGTWRLFDALARKGQMSELRLVDFTDLDAIGTSLEGVDLVWLETPSNPLLRLTDLAAVAQLAHAAGSLVAADNTFCSPALQNPIALGADVVVHSTTKYLNGHSDVVGGAAIAADAEVGAQLAWWANCMGITGSSFDSYLTLRGLRTLGVRMRAHQENAAALADLLASHDAVRAVHYPGLATHPGHELATRQQRGYGGMLSFELADLAAAERCVEALRIFSLAESLGGVETLICHPGLMTHAAMPVELQQAAGITPGLLRDSVGIEQTDDLVADLTQALDAAAG